MHIRDLLEQKGLLNKPEPLKLVRAHARSLEEVVPGTWREIAGMRCFYTENAYDLSHQHGSHCLHEVLQVPAETWSPFLIPGSSTPLDIRNAIFLDTETTGLGQHPTTFVFMVGIGCFEDKQFLVRQYMMPDFGSEEGLLEALAYDLTGHQGLVSYNGRCFDWPLLEMRYLLNRKSTPIAPHPHLDLLPLARRLWRRRLGSCALSALENSLLGIQRSANDVPGYLIPQLYIEYIEQQNPEPLAGVFYHNQLDILSMVAMMAAAGGTLAALQNPARADEVDFLALGALFNRLGQSDEALRALRLAAESSPDKADKMLAYKHWSLLLKRLGQWEQAAYIWEQQLGEDDIYPYLELAKYYEHRLRDPGAAAQVVQQAIVWLQSPRSPLSRLERQQFGAELQHRLARLERKCECPSGH